MFYCVLRANRRYHMYVGGQVGVFFLCETIFACHMILLRRSLEKKQFVSPLSCRGSSFTIPGVADALLLLVGNPRTEDMFFTMNGCPGKRVSQTKPTDRI